MTLTITDQGSSIRLTYSNGKIIDIAKSQVDYLSYIESDYVKINIAGFDLKRTRPGSNYFAINYNNVTSPVVASQSALMTVLNEYIPTASIPIIDTDVTTMITNPANWDGNGNYTGPDTGLVAGNYYYDDSKRLKYEWDGTTLRRFVYNDTI